MADRRGLKPGERVIVDGIQRITPGEQVRPIPVSENGAAPSAPGGAPGKPENGKERST